MEEGKLPRWERRRYEGIDTSEIYFWGKKSRANYYAIKSQAASREVTLEIHVRSFAFDLK